MTKVCGLLLFALCLSPDLRADELGAKNLQVPVETLLALAEIDTAASAPSPKKHTPLSPLTQIIRRVVADNQQIQMQKTDWKIRQAEAEETRAIFEPELITTLERRANSQRNSIEEALSRNSASTYDEDNWAYDASVQALAPTGGKVKLGYNFNRLSNSLTSSLTSEDNEYQMYLGVNLTQPLLKNAGASATKAGIMAADLESSAAFQEYRLKMMQRVSKVSVDYWDYYQAQKKLDLRTDSFRIAEEILADNQERHRTGKMAETEVLEAKIGVNSRQSLLSETAHEQLQIANRLRSLMALTNPAEELEVEADVISPATDEGPTTKTAQPKMQQHNAKILTNKAAEKPASSMVKRVETKHVIDSSNALKFAYGEAGLTAAMEKELRELATTLFGKQKLSIKVIGHTDSHMLSPEKARIYKDNFGLGQVRADNSAKYLAAQLGLNKNQYKVGTGGPFSPIADNSTAAGRAKNRRVEIFIAYDQRVPLEASGPDETPALAAGEQRSQKPPHTKLPPVQRTQVKHIIDNSQALKFASGETTLTASMENDLDALAATLKGKQNLFLEVVGHTDSYMLSEEKARIYGDNFGFGKARARNTAKYLAAQLGLNKAQYKIGTGGPFKPIADNATPEGRAKNRRVEIFITYDQPVTRIEQDRVKPPAPTPAPEPVPLPAPQPARPAPVKKVAVNRAASLDIALSEPKPYRQAELNREELFQAAFKLRPEYLAAKKKLEQAEIKIGFAKNQRWPELDLLASYGLNGLDFNTGDSFEQLEKADYASWSAGLELRLPLRGGIESRSKLKKSKLEKRRQIMLLKDIEIEMKNRIDTAIDNVIKSSEQLHYAEQIIAIQKRLFDIELKKLKAGQSSSRLVLEKEDNYRSARENALTNIVKQQRALIEMDLASGAILQKHGVDIMEAAL